MVCLGVTLLAAAVPLARAFYRVEIDYNEGWNIYNAATVAAHGWLYPAKYAWTSVNYPMLSFVAMAWLHRLTHQYLLTARVVSLVSLLANGVLVGAIVYRLAGSCVRGPATFAAMFTVAMFCANADSYVGMDDPQILAQVFFLAGLYVYISRRSGLAALAAAALLFVVGGFVKHNPVDFPLAVLIDLLLISRWRAVWFGACGLALVVVGLVLHVHYGGPHFIDQLLAPRSWSLMKELKQVRDGLGPILLPVVAAAYMAVRLRHDQGKRIAGIFLVVSVVLGGYFGGGNGVSVNSLFSAMLAVAVLVGLYLAKPDQEVLWRPTLTPAMLFLWLLIPLAISGNWNVPGKIRETRVAQERFDGQVSAIAAEPGPALCESLLRCYAAQKPYVYDPFNSTRLVNLGKLDPNALLQSIDARRYGAIQLGAPIDDEEQMDKFDPALRERFAPEMLEAIRRNYTLSMQDADGAIYVPAAR